MARRASAASAETNSAAFVCIIAWLVPGAGHLWLGRTRQGGVLLVTLLLMFGVGVQLEGQLFSFDFSDPLVALAALADIGLGAPYVVARVVGFGSGTVVAVTYEYGNAFLVVAGLLNMLVVVDAYDIVLGRK